MNFRHTFPALLAAVVFAWGTASQAAPPSDEQVRQLLQVSRAQEMMVGGLQQQFAHMPQQILEQLSAGKNLSQEQQQKIADTLEKVMTAFDKSMSWEKMEPAFIKLYADTFDADDVQAMLRFYQSPAGQKMLAKTPQLMQNMMAFTQELMIPALQEIEKELQQALKN